MEKEVNIKGKNEFGFVVGTRKDAYCKLIKEGGWSQDEILEKVKEEFGSASKNAFNFFLRDCRLLGIRIKRRVTLNMENES